MFKDVDPALQFLVVMIAVTYITLLIFVFELALALAAIGLIGWLVQSVLFGGVGRKIKEYLESKKGE